MAARAKLARKSAEAGNRSGPAILRFMTAAGLVSVEQVADGFGMSKSQLADMVGLGREALYRPARSRAAKTQGRMRDMLEIISRVAEWAGGADQAMSWYKAQPIAAFGGQTAEFLVRQGKAAALRDYLDHVATGGFA